MRPSYLARHSGGRYYLQMRARGVVARELSIRLDPSKSLLESAAF